MERGELDEAARFAVEAIQIGEQLKDEHVIALNRTTLGNVRRDGGELQEALVEYHAADRASVKGRLQDSEAAANELIASVHNQLGEYDVALHHAQHAAAVARLADEQILVARAEEERALALQGKREIDGGDRGIRKGDQRDSRTAPRGLIFCFTDHGCLATVYRSA